MKAKVASLGALLVFVSGCGPSEDGAACSKFETGDQAVVSYSPSEIKYKETKDENKIYLTVKEQGQFGLPEAESLAPGTVVSVGFDPGYYEITTEDLDKLAKHITDPKEAEETRKSKPFRRDPPNPMSGSRDVKVVVETGRYKGSSGSIRRDHLRPKK